MKIDTFIKKLEPFLEEGWGIQAFFEKNYEATCPCFSGSKKIDGKTLYVRGRCWRVSDNAQDLHVWGDLDKKDLKKIGRVIKKCLDKQKWYNPYTLIIHGKKYGQN